MLYKRNHHPLTVHTLKVLYDRTSPGEIHISADCGDSGGTGTELPQSETSLTGSADPTQGADFTPDPFHALPVHAGANADTQLLTETLSVRPFRPQDRCAAVLFHFFICLAGHRSSLPCLRAHLVGRGRKLPYFPRPAVHFGTPALYRFSCQTGKKIS